MSYIEERRRNYAISVNNQRALPYNEETSLVQDLQNPEGVSRLPSSEYNRSDTSISDNLPVIDRTISEQVDDSASNQRLLSPQENFVTIPITEGLVLASKGPKG